jgi:TorA maturation chaperone TorD
VTELLRALGVLAEPPSPEGEAVARALGLGGSPTTAEYTELFLLNLYPYASVYLGDEGMLGGEARDRVAGFWRALGLVPPAEPDHLATLLGLYAALADEDMPPETPVSDAAPRSHAALHGPGVGRRVQQALLWEHVLSWLPAYLEKAKELAPRFYREWAELLDAALVAEAERYLADGLLPLHLRAAAPLADPREDGLEPFLTSVLAPVRSGLVLTRADVARGARELGLGMRMGERRFLLRALLAQDAPGTLHWLRAEAESWAGRHRRMPRALVPVTDFWAARAERTAALVTELEAATDRDGLRVPERLEPIRRPGPGTPPAHVRDYAPLQLGHGPSSSCREGE